MAYEEIRRIQESQEGGISCQDEGQGQEDQGLLLEAVMQLGRPVEYDWEALKQEKEASGKTTKEFCAEKNMSYTNMCREFAALEREEIKDSIAQFQKVIAKSLPDMAKGLIELTKDEDKNVQLKAIIATTDRIGLSPNAVNLQVNNNSTVNILAVPIFASVASPMMDKFLGSVDADTKTDS